MYIAGKSPYKLSSFYFSFLINNLKLILLTKLSWKLAQVAQNERMNERASPAPVLGNLQSVMTTVNANSPTQSSTASPTPQLKVQHDSTSQVLYLISYTLTVGSSPQLSVQPNSRSFIINVQMYIMVFVSEVLNLWLCQLHLKTRGNYAIHITPKGIFINIFVSFNLFLILCSTRFALIHLLPVLAIIYHFCFGYLFSDFSELFWVPTYQETSPKTMFVWLICFQIVFVINTKLPF